MEKKSKGRINGTTLQYGGTTTHSTEEKGALTAKNPRKEDEQQEEKAIGEFLEKCAVKGGEIGKSRNQQNSSFLFSVLVRLVSTLLRSRKPRKTE